MKKYSKKSQTRQTNTIGYIKGIYELPKIYRTQLGISFKNSYFCIYILSLIPIDTNNMDTKKLIDTISSNAALSKDDSGKLLNEFSKIVSESLLEGDSVCIPSIGVFETKLRAERYAIHPSSGKRLLVPPKLSVVFKPSNILKQKIR